MNIDTNNLVSITEANQNFSKIARMVDENGSVVILKNNAPRYVLVEFNELLLHKDLISEFGGLDGVKDLGMLESAINAPFQTFNYQDMYPTIQQKAARLCYGLVKNHPFIDGNKRIGVHAMLVFLALNRIELEYSQEELYTIILNIASSQATIEDLSSWIIDHQL